MQAPTTAWVNDFAVNGYVITTGLLSHAELDTYGVAVDRAVERRTDGDQRTLEDKTDYEQSFVQCMRLWETDPQVGALTFHLGLAETAAQLLGVERVRIWQDQALYKEPGGRITDPHQDAPFWPIGDAPMVTAWIPFDDVSLDGGAMGYVPGSHQVGRLTMVNLTQTIEAYDILNDPALEGRTPTYVEVPKGSVVWHHGMTVHGALPNNTDSTRRAFTVVYIADGYRRAEPYKNFPLDRAGVEVGDLMQGDGLPLAWPRVGEQLPSPPATLGEPTGPQVKRDD